MFHRRRYPSTITVSRCCHLPHPNDFFSCTGEHPVHPGDLSGGDEGDDEEDEGDLLLLVDSSDSAGDETTTHQVPTLHEFQ